MKFIQWIEFFGENKIILGIASICGIFGFILTIFVSVRTSHISKILNRNNVADTYNKKRGSYQKSFNGHISSIVKDEIHTNQILKNILKDTTAYYEEFNVLLPFNEKIKFKSFFRMIKKEAKDVDFNAVTNFLTVLAGKLEKKEIKKNG